MYVLLSWNAFQKFYFPKKRRLSLNTGSQSIHLTIRCLLHSFVYIIMRPAIGANFGMTRTWSRCWRNVTFQSLWLPLKYWYWSGSAPCNCCEEKRYFPKEPAAVSLSFFFFSLSSFLFSLSLCDCVLSRCFGYALLHYRQFNRHYLPTVYEGGPEGSSLLSSGPHRTRKG